MTDITQNKLHITEQSKKNLERHFGDNNEELIRMLKNLPENPDEISKQADKIRAQKAKEKKEKKEKLLFEEDTFKIDSKWWKEATDKDDPITGKFVDKWIRVKANPTWDVVEYLKGDAKWEQIFITYDAFIREVCKAKNCSKEEVEKKYLMTIDELEEKMKDKPDGSEEYKKFFNQEIKDHLAGYWDPHDRKFYSIGGRSDVWLVGGGNATFIQSLWHWDYNDSGYGFSGRLLKN